MQTGINLLIYGGGSCNGAATLKKIAISSSFYFKWVKKIWPWKENQVKFQFMKYA